MRNIKFNILLISSLLHCCNNSNLTESGNTPPVVNMIKIEPEYPTINQVVKLTTFATDADKQELFYRWSVSKGALSNEGIGNPIYWSTPNTEGNVTIVSMVYDGEEMVTKSIGVDVFDESEIDE